MSLLRIVLAAALAACLPVAPSSAQEASDWRTKVDGWVVERAQVDGEVEFLVFLGEQADLSAAARLSSKEEKGRFVYETLRATAARSQAPLLRDLTQAGVQHRSFWVANMIWTRGGTDLVRDLAKRAEVAHIYANPQVELDRPMKEAIVQQKSALATEPSLQHTLVPEVFWAAGHDGSGVVIGGQDTGYQWDHPALRSSYRGTAGGSVDHNYNWHDSIHSGGGSCGPDSAEPCDDDDHGTHTMGTMVGDDGAANQIGMAPGARWIGCRNMNQGVGTPASYSECFEWFIAPTDLAGENADPGKAPDIINNSWSCPPGEGCQDPNALRTVVENTRAAGILIVVSAGNAGPACETINNPAGIYDASFTVGATTLQDFATSFSSRGPVSVDGSGRIKPDISAPGQQIRSSLRLDRYGSLSGTSMAAPHVAGLAALLISSAGCLRGDVDALEQHIISSAQPVTGTEFCGVPGDEIPNNTYGYGAIRAVLPTCGGGVSGAMTGMSTKKLTCRNRSAKPSQKVKTKLGGDSDWSCSAEGLVAGDGDRLKIQLTADADGDGAVGGTVLGIPKLKVVCRNRTSGGKKTLRPGEGESWDCREAGLEIVDGDSLKLTVSGKAG